MPKLEDVKFSNDEQIDWDAVGEQGGGRRGPLPLGDYVFQLPSDVGDSWTSPFEVDGKTYVSFFPEVTVIGGDDSRVGQTRKFLIGGLPRNRAKAGQTEVRISDLEYFYKNGLHTKAELKAGFKMPGTFKELCQAVQKEAPNAKFQATVEWEAVCDKKNVRNIFAEDNSVIPDPTGAKGCGARYYSSSTSKPIPRNPEDGSLPFVFQCGCGGEDARVAVWSNDRIGRFKKVE